MQRSIESISEGIVHVSYTFEGEGPERQRVCEPLDFFRKGSLCLRQSGLTLTPKTVYRYEVEGAPVIKKKQTANGEVSYVENMRKLPAGSAYTARLVFSIGTDELLMGLGQYEDGICDYRNRTEYLYQSNMRIAVPLLMTTGHYAILIDSESSMIFRSEGERIEFEIDTCDSLSYYVFTGDGIEELIRHCYEVTGMPSMLPAWAFGYIQSKERYQSGGELVDTVKRFRDLDIPLDCIVQDWCSWEPGRWGEKRFDKGRYPDLPATVRSLHEMHTHFMVSIWPNMSPDSDDYRQFEEQDLLLPNSNLYNAFDERARSIYWDQCREEIMESGTDALWCDSAEPFSDADWWGCEKRPEKERYDLVTEASMQSMDPCRLNSYGLYHAKGIYEHWRRDYPEKRVVNLIRSGYTGSWKYGTILWSGDITARYDTMRAQITEGIKASLSGIPYWTLDIGGFFTVDDKYENRGCDDSAHQPLWFWRGDYNDGVADPAYRELYVRWLQFGTFLPVFRSHGTDTPREPWRFGSPGEPFYDAIVSFIRLRYRLMPYIYSLGAAAHMRGSVMMRSLLLDFADDETVRDIRDEYMFGPAFLVAPVTEPIYYPKEGRQEHNAETRRVYLPGGCGWYDYYTNDYYEGGCFVEAEAPLSRMPLFVRAGSIVPMSDGGNHSRQCMKADRIVIYEGGDGRFLLYTDEGDGYGFERGEYCLEELSYTESSHSFHADKISGQLPTASSRSIEYKKRCFP